jgi:hypothetical protein
VIAIAGITACGGGGGGGYDGGSDGGGNNTPPQVDATTAPVIASEAYLAQAELGGSGSFVGQQFFSINGFGELRASNPAPGVVPPTIFLCDPTGSVTVSGNVQVTGTFTAGDTLTAVFADCAYGPITTYNGRIDVTVTSYIDFGFNSFNVSATAIFTDLDNDRFTANGTLDLVWDGTSSGIPTRLLVQTFTDQMEFVQGLVTRSALDAESHVIVDFPTMGAPDLTLNIDATGEMSTTLLPGSFIFETLAPFVQVSDNDPLNGPGSGTLLVSAEDGGTVTLETIDNTSVNLELDPDGDGTMDDTLFATWDEISPP